MKFAKELERELVPEWRIKYLNYKAGKKRITAVARALRAAAPTPRNLNELARTLTNRTNPSGSVQPPFSPRSWHGRITTTHGETQSLRLSPAPLGRSPPLAPKSNPTPTPTPNPNPTPKSPAVSDEQKTAAAPVVFSPPAGRHPDTPAIAISPAPPVPDVVAASSPSPRPFWTRTREARYSFSLPAPALEGGSGTGSGSGSGSGDADVPSGGHLDDPVITRPGYFMASSAPAVATASPRGPRPSYGAVDLKPPIGSAPSPNPDDAIIPSDVSPRLRSLARKFTMTRHGSDRAKPIVDTDALDTLRMRQRDFYDFLDTELVKVEDFYKEKEEQAGERLKLLRKQLREMRDRRTREMEEARQKRQASAAPAAPAVSGAVSAPAAAPAPESAREDRDASPPRRLGWTTPIRARFLSPAPGSNSKSLQQMPRTPIMSPQSALSASAPAASMPALAADANRDYARRRPRTDVHHGPEQDEVPYRLAKRKLKLALQEYHRSLELLKSYALLNRTAFRKLNKKYDKAVGAKPALTGQYMTNHINDAYFVKSQVLDEHLRTVEDLYARYFERGNRKVAVGKLRQAEMARHSSAADISDKAFWSGIMIGLGVLLACQGLYLATKLMRGPAGGDDDLTTHTAYLLQVYGGYFIGLALFGLFCLNCKVWSANKVNYHFIFEFNPRDQLDWRELAVFPSFFMFLFGLCMWLNFSQYGDPAMFLYYPVVLIAITVGIVLFPAPILWHRSRKWLASSHGRLLCAGLYPVEFRDFFLGDMYCSLTYAVANIELFFCLYARAWDEPEECNSSHSRLLGFLVALPPIWRFLQCIRRYRDTRNVFPHLVNCGKYAATIATAAAQSFYRIGDTGETLGIYVALAIINAVYCSFWDLFMDFSLLQPHSRHLWLRDILAIKQRWLYYTVLVVDPVLRFAWIPYAAVASGTQHSSAISFGISLAEVCRRAFWALFRVENEHCANVAQYKASRDVPLPYRLELFVEQSDQEEEEEAAAAGADTTAAATVTAAPSPSPLQQQQQQGKLGAPQQPSPAIGTPLSRARAKSNAAQSIVGAPLDEADHGVEPSPRILGRATPGDDPSGETGGASTGAAVRGRRRPSFGPRLSISKMIAEAHKQDFEKRRKPEPESSKHRDQGEDVMSLDDATEDDEADPVKSGLARPAHHHHASGALTQLREEHDGQEDERGQQPSHQNV